MKADKAMLTDVNYQYIGNTYTCTHTQVLDKLFLSQWLMVFTTYMYHGEKHQTLQS